MLGRIWEEKSLSIQREKPVGMCAERRHNLNVRNTLRHFSIKGSGTLVKSPMARTGVARLMGIDRSRIEFLMVCLGEKRLSVG